MSVSVDFIKENFIFVSKLNDGSNGLTEIVRGFDNKLYVRKFIPYINLPYKKLLNKENPNLVKIFYVAEDSNSTYVIEEYISGITLKEKLQNAYRFTDSEVEKIALQLCDGLAFLHKLDILHRDITPSNIILINGTQQVKIIDLGAARSIQEKAMDTRLLGTPGYAPPEQYGFSSTDTRSDIFSLGKTMLELLENSRNKRLKVVFQRCTELDPINRYQSIDELKKALENKYTFQSIPKNWLFATVLLACCYLFYHAFNYYKSNTIHSELSNNENHSISSDNISNNDSANFNTSKSGFDINSPTALSSRKESIADSNLTSQNANNKQSMPKQISKIVFKQLDNILIFDQTSFSIYEDGLYGKYSFKPFNHTKPIIRIHNASEEYIENPIFEFWANHLGIIGDNFSYKNSYGDVEYVNLLKRSSKKEPVYLYRIKLQGKIPPNSDYSIESLTQLNEFYGVYTSNNRGRKNILIRAHSKYRIDDLPYEIIFK